MRPTWMTPSLIALCACMLLTSAARATPHLVASKLDNRLAPIAEAAEQHVETALMERALVRQDNHSNSPFEARWNASGQVQVYLHYAPGAAAPGVIELENLGATDIKQSPEMNVIQAWLPATALKAAAGLPGISHVGLPRYAIHKRITPAGPVAYTGSRTTEGDEILGTAQFRSSTGITGQGITVGVISDGDDHISEPQKTGDLPTDIVNDPNDTGSFKSSGDEGTAMMEIIYDLAPGVKQLGFCGPQTTVDFITCLDDFATNIGANVIVDDLGFPGGAMFSDDTFNTAIKNFSAAHPGIRLVAATGNDAENYWQGSWQPMTVSTSVNGQSYTQAQNFGTSLNPVAYLKVSVPQVGDKIAYIVEWNDPWDDNAKTNDPNDYDVVVFDNPNGDASGSPGHAVACNQGINVGPTSGGTLCDQPNTQSTTSPGPLPVQGSVWTSSQGTYYLEVFLHAGSPGANLKIILFDASTPFPVPVDPVTPGSVYGHAALAYPTEISAGAIFAPDAVSGVYNIEPYSSRGPVEYGVTTGTPQSIMKPDFAAPDCVTVTGAGGFPTEFCGTSAAAPHIAGLVALLMSGYPSQSPYTLLQKAAFQPGSGTPNGTFGYGVPIMTNLLTAGTYPSPTATISAPADGTSVTTGQKVAFTGSCAMHGAPGSVTQDWSFGAGSGIADSNLASTSATYTTAGTYTVSLKCTDSSGSGTASINLTVNAPPSKGGGSMDLLSMLALGLLTALDKHRRKRA